jgi:hypothetical protein
MTGSNWTLTTAMQGHREAGRLAQLGANQRVANSGCVARGHLGEAWGVPPGPTWCRPGGSWRCTSPRAGSVPDPAEWHPVIRSRNVTSDRTSPSPTRLHARLPSPPESGISRRTRFSVSPGSEVVVVSWATIPASRSSSSSGILVSTRNRSIGVVSSAVLQLSLRSLRRLHC